MSKSEFIRSLQHEEKGLSPYDVSQRVRLSHSCVSTYQGDPLLKVADYRGYMTRFEEKTDRTPANPELYVCIISLDQSKQWQDLVWTKEILQILDDKGHRTYNKDALAHMLDNRAAQGPTPNGTPLNVMADKNGFTLALGSMVPKGYRDILRKQRAKENVKVELLEKQILVPAEFIEWLLSDKFEADFETALKECD